MEKHNIRNRWVKMLSRCEDEGNIQYKDYGGRGIEVCDDWHDFNKFYQWCIDNNIQPHLQIDRTHVDGNYSPDNCKLVTRKQNARNKRNTKELTAFGEKKSASEWVEDIRCIVSYSTLLRRIGLGWNTEDALTILPKTVNKGWGSTAKRFEAFGEEKTINSWAHDARCLVGKKTLFSRLHDGWDTDKALTTPLGYQHGKLYEGHNVSHWFRDPRCLVGYGTLNRRLNQGWSIEDALTTPARSKKKDVIY